jgi:hypothetical protein
MHGKDLNPGLPKYEGAVHTGARGLVANTSPPYTNTSTAESIECLVTQTDRQTDRHATALSRETSPLRKHNKHSRYCFYLASFADNISLQNNTSCIQGNFLCWYHFFHFNDVSIPVDKCKQALTQTALANSAQVRAVGQTRESDCVGEFSNVKARALTG